MRSKKSMGVELMDYRILTVLYLYRYLFQNSKRLATSLQQACEQLLTACGYFTLVGLCNTYTNGGETKKKN